MHLCLEGNGRKKRVALLELPESLETYFEVLYFLRRQNLHSKEINP
jgi:hypothetical protein